MHDIFSYIGNNRHLIVVNNFKMFKFLITNILCDRRNISGHLVNRQQIEQIKQFIPID